MIDEAATRGADLTQHLLAFRPRKQPLAAAGGRTSIALIVETRQIAAGPRWASGSRSKNGV